MMSRIDAHAMAKNTFVENFSVQKCLTIILLSQDKFLIFKQFINQRFVSNFIRDC